MSSADDIPYRLAERTGRHLCVSCLAETPAASFFVNDHLCDACAAREEYPLASTPSEAVERPRKRGSGAK
jgi:NMD protein affecting ribosome stability and mRNA decay